MHKPGNNGPPPGRSTPDDRHIIRMAQTPSPRTKMAYHEPVSPPENQQQQQQQQQQHFYQSQGQTTISAANSDPRSLHNQFALDHYVKNRIVEVMRTTAESKRGQEQQQQQQNHHKEKEERGSPGEMVIDEGRPQSAGEKKEHANMFQGRPGSQPHQQFQGATYAYPFSALNVSAGPPITINAKASAEALDSRPSTMMESKPLLSAKYEALSDED